jgi:DNA polymerase sigma
LKDQLLNYSEILNKAREVSIEFIKEVLKSEYRERAIKIIPYGSYSTKLLTPYSDVDLSIQGLQNFTRESSISFLESLSEVLRRCSFTH